MKEACSKFRCRICESPQFETYFYGDHLGIRSLPRMKAEAAKFLKPFIERYIKNLDTRLLFSPNRRIFVCQNCGHGLADDWNVSSTILQNYYESSYWHSNSFTQNQDVISKKALESDDRASGQYEFIKPYLDPLPTTSLEIGAASAMLSRLLKRQYPHLQANVVEAGAGWTDYYQQLNLKKMGHYYPLHGQDHSFDFISGSHWLEHFLPEIERVVRQIYSDLKNEGHLFIEVPNCEEIYWQNDIGDIPHLHFFTTQSLSQLFSKFGFSVLRIGTFGETFEEHLEFLNHHSKHASALPLVSKAAQESSRFSVDREGGTVIRALFKKSQPSN